MEPVADTVESLLKEREALISLQQIFSHALFLATEGDRAAAMQLLESASVELGIEIPAVSCAVPPAA